MACHLLCLIAAGKISEEISNSFCILIISLKAVYVFNRLSRISLSLIVCRPEVLKAKFFIKKFRQKT